MHASTPSSADQRVTGVHCDLVEAFRVLDGVAEVLGMVLDGQESSISSAASALHVRFAAAEQLLDSLPGGDMTREAQLLEAKRLVSELERKRKLVVKHRDLPLLVEKLGAKQSETRVEEKQPGKVPLSTVAELGLENIIGVLGDSTIGIQKSDDADPGVDAAMQTDFARLEKETDEPFIATTTSLEESGAVPSSNEACLYLDNGEEAGPLSDSIMDGF
jgi:hypothetical protein